MQMQWTAGVLVVLVVCLCCSYAASESCASALPAVAERGWNTTAHVDWLETSRCTLDKLRMSSLSEYQFRSFFVEGGRPVVLVRDTVDKRFQEMTKRENLLAEFGHLSVVLSSSNTFSYDKIEETVEHYIHHRMEPQTLEAQANTTFYKFGNNHPVLDRQLLSKYSRPPFLDANNVGSLSFGFAGSGSGVPFHRHGHVFAEVLHGRKRWFLYDAVEEPDFDPDGTTLKWLHDVYPTLPEDELPMECVLGPGEVLYLPDWIWHATLNIGETVFVSTFV
mmetsp:Transcript_16481/g.64309  ORF Transcript_16481/g.64309 Transcript_16481/m.64309 type:complete len:277 (-) Transcript_16481:46-876(-)